MYYILTKFVILCRNLQGELSTSSLGRRPGSATLTPHPLYALGPPWTLTTSPDLIVIQCSEYFNNFYHLLYHQSNPLLLPSDPLALTPIPSVPPPRVRLISAREARSHSRKIYQRLPEVCLTFSDFNELSTPPTL